MLRCAAKHASRAFCGCRLLVFWLLNRLDLWERLFQSTSEAMADRKILLTAAGWMNELIGCRTQGEIPPEIWSAFEAWLGEDPEHRAAYLSMEQAGRALAKRTLREHQAKRGQLP
jgi:ferric-dicitrate binding protein FerR (iron transport regulator)